jgi:hypothetical protein
MPNPNTDQGVLNRVRATINWNNFNISNLNVNPQNLGKEGIRLALEGNATDYFPTMTGAVPSPAPYQIATLTINLLKSQIFAQGYKAQFEVNTLLGQCVVWPDVVQPNGISSYTLWNCVLESVREMTFSGEDPLYVITVKGYYEVNSAMFDS